MLRSSLARLSFTLLAMMSAATSPRATERISGFHSVKADLPFGDRAFAEGLDSDPINNNCLACHSAGTILNQSPLSRAAWQAEVDKMRNDFKAPIDEADMKPMVDYLVRLRGN
jgi:hypothetical protein